jgi:hypothetical protein
MAATAITPSTLNHLSLPTGIHQAKEVDMNTTKLDLMAFGWGLSAALVVLVILCALAAMIFPGWSLAHNWLTLFSAADVGSLRNLIEGVISSVIMGWITATILVLVYNRLVRSNP